MLSEQEIRQDMQAQAQWRQFMAQAAKAQLDELRAIRVLLEEGKAALIEHAPPALDALEVMAQAYDDDDGVDPDAEDLAAPYDDPSTTPLGNEVLRSVGSLG